MAWQQETWDVVRAISTQRAIPPQKHIDGPALAYAMLSYSIAGEDIALSKMFKGRLRERRPGIYVDVGAGSPIGISNTYLFYCHGWRGVCIDPIPGVADDWKKYRPGDAYVPAAVAPEGGRTFYFRHKKNFGMSCIRPVADSLGDEFQDPIPVSVMRLDAILAKTVGDKPIQFMNLDVEGSELGVLQSNDWSRWKPEAILMECHAFDFDNPYAPTTTAFLRDVGYRIIGKIDENVLMTCVP